MEMERQTPQPDRDEMVYPEQMGLMFVALLVGIGLALGGMVWLAIGPRHVFDTFQLVALLGIAYRLVVMYHGE